jgi:hypothetical protein
MAKSGKIETSRKSPLPRQPVGAFGAAAVADWSICVEYKVLQPGTNVNKQQSRYGFPEDGGAIGRRLRSRDCWLHPLGPVDTRDGALRTGLGIVPGFAPSPFHQRQPISWR